jgi:hypothetical protein
MIPKGKLLALLMIFVAVGGVAATGAFTTVEAERTADVSVDGDANALLAIQPNDEGTNDFIQQSDTDNSQLEIDLSGGTADSLNTNAATNEENIITITNNGENAVSFFIATEGGLQDGSTAVDGSTPEGGASGDSDVSNNVNVEFYIDDGKVVESAAEPSDASSGSVAVDSDLADSPVTLADEIAENGDSSLDTFVDVASSSPSTSTDSDYSITHEGDRTETPGSDATAVELAPGQSVDVSIYIEIDVDDSQFNNNGDLSDVSVLENIVIIAQDTNQVDGALVDPGSN